MALAALACLGMLVISPGEVSAADRGIKGAPVVKPAVAAPAVDDSRRVALVIGNSAYRHKGQRLSINPAEDARAIAKQLEALRFKVEMLTDLTKDDMAKRLEQFKRSADGAGVALFYFAGHGVQLGGDNRLIPVDVDMESEFQVKYNSTSLESVLDVIAGAGAKIVILDACRNNPFKLSGGGGLAAVKGGPRTLVAFATGHGTVADDGKPGQHGRYTRHLLNFLKKPGLTIVEVFMYTREAVAAESGGQQVPWDSSSWAPPPLVLLPGPAAAAAAGSAPEQRLARGLEFRARRAGLATGDTFRDCDRCPEMVVVPAGAFRMGALAGEAGARANEGPQREVTITRPLAVGRFEVTFDEWQACLLDGGCDRWPQDQGWGRGRRPVIDVSWEDAQRYVAWLNKRLAESAGTGGPAPKYRLLSEAEWEYAARAGTTTARPWNEAAAPAGAGCKECGTPGATRRTTEVNATAANNWKLHGMVGNVWEWVQDCSNVNYEGAPTDGSAWDIRGKCELRGIRGGSFLTAAKGTRAATRSFYPVQRRDLNIGFRVATDLH